MTSNKSLNWWKDLGIICEANKESNWFDQRIRWKIGNGSRIKFWEDWWVGEQTLKEKFPRLYGVSVLKDKMVSEFCLRNDFGNPHVFIWRIPWRRGLFEWEKELQNQLEELINNVVWNTDMFDQWCWVGESVNVYTVHSGYWALKEIPDVQSNECFGEIWSLKVLGITKIFGWRVLLDRLPFRVNLERRGILVSSNMCPLCNKDVETLQHLLITCEVA